VNTKNYSSPINQQIYKHAICVKHKAMQKSIHMAIQLKFSKNYTRRKMWN